MYHQALCNIVCNTLRIPLYLFILNRAPEHQHNLHHEFSPSVICTLRPRRRVLQASHFTFILSASRRLLQTHASAGFTVPTTTPFCKNAYKTVTFLPRAHQITPEKRRINFCIIVVLEPLNPPASSDKRAAKSNQQTGLFTFHQPLQTDLDGGATEYKAVAAAHTRSLEIAF